MTQGLTRRRTRWRCMSLFVTATCAVALTPVLAAPTLKELDPVPMVTVPGGSFLMGSENPKGRADEWPQRKVHVDTFAIDQVEVTNERYMAFVATTGHRSPPNPYGTGVLVSAKGIEQLPVVQVTWYDAKAYCAWAKKRLPTEAEWEKAARGTDGRTFPWGNDEAESTTRANFDREWVNEKTLLCRRVAVREVTLPMASRICPVMLASGCRTGTTPTITRMLPTANPQGPREGHRAGDPRRILAQSSGRTSRRRRAGEVDSRCRPMAPASVVSGVERQRSER
jgi:hypothetical protein